ncbi:MAG TPA: SprB repeat-containing protein, partial [Bacteroidia bacterium]
ASVTISQPTKLVMTLNHTNNTVSGGTNGSATANLAGGTSPYTYSWSNGGTTSVITGLSAGTYTLTALDNNNCSLIDSVQIFDPNCAQIILNVNKTNVSCPGGTDGTASAQLFFDAPPYHYVWSNGATTSSITGLSAGVYSVISWGKQLCMNFANITITEPSPFNLSLSPTNISCSSSNDGTIELTVSGGTFPYHFNWSNGINVEDQYYLSDGTYSVIVTDANSCTVSAITSISRPDTIKSTGTKTDVTCNGSSTGSINITVSGGVLPYTFSWSNGATTQNISGLPKGQYILTITDANGCHNYFPLSFLIDEPETALSAAITAQTNVFCKGGDNGAATVTASGGSLSYNYSWNTSPVQNTPTATGLIAGTYIATVWDNNGCTIPATATVTISEPNAALTAAITAQTNVFCKGGDNGSATVTAS